MDAEVLADRPGRRIAELPGDETSGHQMLLSTRPPATCPTDKHCSRVQIALDPELLAVLREGDGLFRCGQRAVPSTQPILDLGQHSHAEQTLRRDLAGAASAQDHEVCV